MGAPGPLARRAAPFQCLRGFFFPGGGWDSIRWLAAVVSDFIGIPCEHLNMNRRVPPALREIHDGLALSREDGFRGNADGVRNAINNNVHAAVHTWAQARVRMLERRIGSETPCRGPLNSKFG